MIALSISDSEAEALLAGSTGVDSDLRAVAEVLDVYKAYALSDRDADFGALIAAAARESRVTPIERFAEQHLTLTKARRPQLVSRVAMAGVVLVALMAASSGMAYAADGAKPGDLLYGLDRALEAVGVNNGGAAERVTEAEALIAAGAIADGLNHAASVLDGNRSNDQAREALEAAAARLGNATSEELRTQVGGLMDYLRTAMASGGGVDGQTVANMTRELGISQADPVGPPAEPGSQADPVGPPAEPGSQADPDGPPAEPGSQNPGRGPKTAP